MLIVFIICAFSTDSQDFGIHNKTLACSIDLYIISLLKHHQELILSEGSTRSLDARWLRWVIGNCGTAWVLPVGAG